MEPSPSFADFMARLDDGDSDEAVRLIHERFMSDLIRFARGRLSPQIRQKEPPEAIANSVLFQFQRTQRTADWQVDGWDGLWRLLRQITTNRCLARVNHYKNTQKRSVEREVQPNSSSGSGAASWEAVAQEMLPEAKLVLGELIEQLQTLGFEGAIDRRDQQRAQQHRQIVDMLVSGGYSREEIAAEVGCSERTVYRTVEKLRGALDPDGQLR